MTPRVRFAPSPTGTLHIGSARTALFNWLFARSKKGTFILRIEDTDQERSTKAFEDDILQGLSWLGLDWDEGPDKGEFGPYHQFQRLEIYKKYAQILLENGSAYRCYCTLEELEARRKEQIAKGLAPKYDGKCRDRQPPTLPVPACPAGRRQAGVDRQPSFVIRFAVPLEGKTIFKDIVRAEISFENNLLDDFVILKSNKYPTYNFACVIDDALMKISHVIRGEDHISNTPRQVLLYEALKFDLPQFVHLPMILGTDRSKLSKRHGASSIMEYKEIGFLRDALINFISLLGWYPTDEKEIMTRDEIINKFTLERISKSNAVFDQEKLKWMNGVYIRELSAAKLLEYAEPFLNKSGFLKKDYSENWLEEVVTSVRDNLSVLSDLEKYAAVYFQDEISYGDAIKAFLQETESQSSLKTVFEKLKEINFSSPQYLHEFLDQIIKEISLPRGKVLKPLRLSITGSTTGPDLYQLLYLFGKEKVLKRIEQVF